MQLAVAIEMKVTIECTFDVPDWRVSFSMTLL